MRLPSQDRSESRVHKCTETSPTTCINDDVNGDHVIVCVAQVVIGGRNKYLINGVNANNLRVQDLFCSVGLNVNNPHFLIMQVGMWLTLDINIRLVSLVHM